MRLIAVALVVFMSMLLSACGLSPQFIDIQPQLTGSTENLGQNQAINLNVVDEREQQHFGSRGGIYQETALIRPDSEYLNTIKDSLTAAFQQRGYNAFNPNDSATPVQVRIHELAYIPETGSVVNRVQVDAKLQVLAGQPGENQYQGVYESSNTYEQPLTPSAKRNQVMINEVLQNALNQLLADTKLHQFITSPAASTETTTNPQAN